MQTRLGLQQGKHPIPADIICPTGDQGPLPLLSSSGFLASLRWLLWITAGFYLLICVCVLVCVFACRGQRWSSLGVDPQAPSTLVLWDGLTGIGGLPVLDQASWPASPRDPMPLLSTAGILSICYCAWPFPWMWSGIFLSPCSRLFGAFGDCGSCVWRTCAASWKSTAEAPWCMAVLWQSVGPCLPSLWFSGTGVGTSH